MGVDETPIVSHNYLIALEKENNNKMQYQTGTVAVSTNSNVVLGVGTAWLGEVTPGELFTVQGSGLWYQIATVDSHVKLTLTAPYMGTTDNAAVYAISRDFTTNYGFPYPIKGDVDLPSILQRALQDIDTRLKQHDDRLTTLGG